MRTLLTSLVAAFAFTSAAQNYTICAGSTLALTAVNPLSLSNPTYALSPGSVVQYTPQFTVNPTSSTTYTLYTAGTNSNSAVVTTSSTANVFVKAIIPSNFTSSLSLQCITNGSVNLLSI